MSNLSVALSSTGFKFPAHAGVLTAIDSDRDTDIVEIAGSSGGALIGGMYACGVSLPDIKTWCVHSNWLSFYQNGIGKGGLIDLKDFAKHLDKLMGHKRLGDLGIDFKAMACDLNSHSQVVLSRDTFPEMKVSDAVRASIAIPGVFTPLHYQGLLLSDGAIMNTLPINMLHANCAKVGFRVTYPAVYKVPPTTSMMVIARRAIYMIVDRGNSWAVDKAGVPVMDIHTGYADGLDVFMGKHKRHKLIDSGYHAAMKFVDSY